MAESYRGLTIRIGGDTSKLSQALRSANQAISGTQSSLRKLSDALKLDPSSLKASQLQVGAFAEQASNAAARLVTLNEAMRQVGDTIPKGASQTVSEMAASLGNVQMKAAQAREHFNGLTKELAVAYTELSKMSAEAAKIAGENVGKDWTITTDVDEMVKEMDKLPESIKASSSAMGEFKSEVSKLQSEYVALQQKVDAYRQEWGRARSDAKRAEISVVITKTLNEMDKLIEKFDKAKQSFTALSGTTYKFDNKNVDLEDILQALNDINTVNNAAMDSSAGLYEQIAALKGLWEDSRDTLNAANMTAQYADLEAEAAKAAAKVKSLVDEMVRLSDTSTVAKGLVAVKQELNEIATRGANAQNRLKSILEIMSKDGNQSSTFMQREAMREYAEATDEAESAVRNIREQLDQYDDSVRNLAASTKSYVAETAAAKDEYERSAAALKGYEGAMEELKKLQLKMQESDPTGFGDNEDYKNLQRTLSAMEEVVGRLKQQFAAAEKEKEKFVQIGEVRELYSDLHKANDAVSSLAKINIKPEVDLDGVKGLEKALQALSDGTFALNGVTHFADNVKIASSALEDARKRYQALTEAAKKDPTNSETLRQRTEAFDQVVEKTIAHINALRAEIDGIPSEKIDEAALAAGNVQENFQKAKKKVDDYVTGIRDLNRRIEELTKERKGIKVVTDDDKKRVEELDASIKRLKATRDEMAAKGDKAFDSLVIADNTRRVEEHTAAIQTDEAALHELGEVARGVHSQDATPKIDEAAFMQVIDRIAQAARRMGSEMVQSANEIDSAYRDMRKTVNGTEQDFENLKQVAIDYSQHSFTSADTMLEMQALGGQLGVLTEDLEQFGKITSNLDIATDIDVQTVALKLGQISNVLQLDIDGMQGFSDALVRLGNNMPAQESAIMAVAQRFGAVAATAKFSGDEILAWSAAIAATGQRSESAATAISNTVSGIEQAIASGGNDLKQFAAISSMTADEFKKSWETSPTETLRAFIEGLKTLKDSDESAVAALENMGITGVRQQQTLLALTQTVESLDKALVMSRDAWNGVNDQWGQAGDAANEAAKKAEGFSGSLAIMQNNAQNLASVLGESLVPYIDAAAAAMEIVTDVLRDMPSWVKTLIVSLGGASVAFSTLTPMLNIFSKGLTSVLMAANDAKSIGDFITRVTGLKTALDAAADAGVGLGGALSGPVLLGITAAVGALAFAVSAINDYKEKQESIRTATEGLVTATQSAASAYSEYVSGAQNATRSVSELREAVDLATESQANLASQMSDAWGQIGSSEATVDLLVQKMGELASKSSLTALEQNELLASVATFNNLTGQSVQVVDAATGKLSDSVSVIQGYADSWKRATESSQHMEDYENSIQQLAEKTALLEEVNAKIAETGTDTSGKFVDLRDSASSLTGAYSDLIKQQEELENDIAYLQRACNDAVAGMDGLDRGVADVERAFAATGDSLSNYGNFTDSELQKIVNAFFSASGDSIEAVENVKRAIDALRGASGDASTIAGELESASKQATTAAYNAKKAEFDAEYKAQQNAFNAEYKAAQSAYNNAYKAQQKAYDKQYKALQKQLDKQYKARKEAYDNQLKKLKKSQEAEVEAFKKATEAKLALMKKEYEQRVKLLEIEYGNKTDDIDAQIKALQAQTEAEKKAIEERERAEKVAELERAVTSAKSRRRRAEAEKELNDYLAEIEQQRNEESRQARIEALEEQKDLLKDELSERKEQLKEEYDDEVAAYKDMRAKQLAELQEANEAQYNALKDSLDARLELLKEKQQAQLEALKESQQASLEAMKESQQAALDGLKASQQEQLEALKADQKAKLEAIKAGTSEEEEVQKRSVKNIANMRKKSMEEILTDEDKLYGSMERRTTEWGQKTQRTTDETGQNMGSAMDRHLTTMERRLDTGGYNAISAFANSLQRGEGTVSRTMVSITAGATSPFESMPSEFYIYGWDMLVEFNNGLVRAWNSGGIISTITYIGRTIRDYLGFSVPKKGPLSDADKWGPDMVQLLADGIKSKQDVLVHQVEKMSDAMEEAFDPTLTVDAAYEALDTISKGRKATFGELVESKSTPSVNLTLNMSLSDVTIRDESDIEKLAELVSEKMAAQAARQLAGRLG